MCPVKYGFAAPTVRERTSEAPSQRASRTASTSTHNVLTHQVHASGQSGMPPALDATRQPALPCRASSLHIAADTRPEPTPKRSDSSTGPVLPQVELGSQLLSELQTCRVRMLTQSHYYRAELAARQHRFQAVCQIRRFECGLLHEAQHVFPRSSAGHLR